MTLRQLNILGKKETIAEMKKRVNIMLSHYDTARRQVEKRIKRVWDSLKNTPPELWFNKIAQADKLVQLNAQITNIYNEYAVLANQELIKSSKIALSNSYYRDQYASSWFTPLGTSGTVLPFTYLDPISTDLAVWHSRRRFDQLQNMVRKRKLSGMVAKYPGTLKEIMHHNRLKDLAKVKDTITQGLIQGKGYKQMANDMKGVFNESKNSALRVARTEGNANMNGAQYLQNREARLDGAGVVRKILSVLDSRTRAQSSVVDGLAEDVDGFFHYPGGVLVSYPGNSGIPAWDINDRETTIETVDGVDPKVRRGRNPNTGENEVATYRTFGPWAKKNGLIKNDYGEIVVGNDAKRTAEKQVRDAVDRNELFKVQI
jgi:hypothetical protein